MLAESDAKDYIRQYCKEEFGEDLPEELTLDVIFEIDKNNDGKISKKELYNHIKLSKEMKGKKY